MNNNIYISFFFILYWAVHYIRQYETKRFCQYFIDLVRWVKFILQSPVNYHGRTKSAEPNIAESETKVEDSNTYEYGG